VTIPVPVLVRCSPDVARLIGAVAPRQSHSGLVLIDPAKEIFVWTTDGQKFAWRIV